MIRRGLIVWVVTLLLTGLFAPRQAGAKPLVYVTLSSTNIMSNSLSAVAVIDAATHAVVATLPMTWSVTGVAVHPAGIAAYATINRGEVTYQIGGPILVIDSETLAVTDIVAVGMLPGSIVVHPTGTRVYTADYGDAPTPGRLSVVDTASNMLVAYTYLGQAAATVTTHPAGALVYVTDPLSSLLYVIDTKTNAIVTTVPLPWVPWGPGGMRVHPSGTPLYLGAWNEAMALDTTTYSIIGSLPVGAYYLAVNPAGTRLYTTAVVGNLLTVIDTATFSVLAVVDIGRQAGWVAVHPAGTEIYVANGETMTVTVVDAGTLAVAAVVPVMTNPMQIAVSPISCTASTGVRVSGKIEVSGGTASGVALVLRGPGGCSDVAKTDARGRWGLRLPDGDYSVTPLAIGCAFTPATVGFSVSGSDARLASFAGTCS
ncbi:MAG: YncE family protein [Candidatus Rokubacteria bacterium]|nr:YncE family protein [Candidatus Rokubacteria bacterium]